MARSVLRGSVLINIPFLVFCTALAVVFAPVASAQHAGGHVGGAHVGGGVAHPPPPPSHAPVAHPHVVVAPRPGSFGTTNFRYYPRPVRPVPPVFPIYPYPIFWGGPYYGFGWGWGSGWGFNSCWWWPNCNLFWNWGLGYNTVPFYAYGPGNYAAPEPSYEYPQYSYSYGEERADLPQLYLKDGTVLNVTDYWLVDDQLHYTMLEQGKPVEHVVPFDQLDLQTTVNVASQRGFRFVLRNEPVEQYLEHHPDAAPPPVLRREPQNN